jgi:2-polyprenyl-6-methoxyphenol hydroxylase-like FAD-dependent oxidoreductase
VFQPRYFWSGADRQGDVVAGKPLLQIVTSWDRLRQLLMTATDRRRYHYGHLFDRVEQDGSGVRVHFANGRCEHADLLVACDGFRSAVRRQVAPEIEPTYAGYYAWRGAANEADLCPEP